MARLCNHPGRRAAPAAFWLVVLLSLTGPAGAADYGSEVKKAVNSIYGKDIQRHVEVLASDAYEGREAGKKGAVLSGNYIARHYSEYGLKPGMASGTFFQEFSIRGGNRTQGKVANANSLEVSHVKKRAAPKTFLYSTDFIPYSFSGCDWVSGEVVFAGYGISAPEYGYDDYAGLKVEGKIVVVLSHEPQEGDPKSVFEGKKLTQHAAAYQKAKLAEKKGAKAILVVPNPGFHKADPLVDDKTAWPPGAGGDGTVGIPAVRCSRTVVGELFRFEKKDLGKLQDRIDGALKTLQVKMRYARLSLRVSAQGDVMGCGRNVVGLYEGCDDKLKNEYVVIGAHYDHIGMGNFASRGKRGQVHNGANDNASGTAGVILLAKKFTEFEIKVKRTVVFACFDAEEKGLVGSKHYVASSPVPLGSTIAMLNMDMIGRGPPRKIKVGGGTLNKTLHGILSRISARFRMGLDLKGLDSFLRNSDQAPFMDKGIPCIFLSSGLYPDLHRETDDAHLMNQNKMQAIVRTMMLVAVEVANLKERP
jgi:hypothetical protein